MSHRVRKTRRHAKRPRDRVTRNQINRVRRYFNQAVRLRVPYDAAARKIMDELRSHHDDGALLKQYLHASEKLHAGFQRLRRENHVNPALIRKVMRHKEWSREQVCRPIPADA